MSAIPWPSQRPISANTRTDERVAGLGGLGDHVALDLVDHAAGRGQQRGAVLRVRP